MTALLAIPLALAAFLYAAVGHGGASGYLAVMALVGVPPETMRPLSLLMNIMVAGIGTLFFYRQKSSDIKMTLALLAGSVPAATWASQLALHGVVYKALVGILLLWAAWQVWQKGTDSLDRRTEILLPFNWGWLLPIGAIIGVIAGLTGTGGGIFLSPLLLTLGWATPKQTSAIAAPFVAVNSIAALWAIHSPIMTLATTHGLWITAAVGGGLAGAYYGSMIAQRRMFCSLLALVLLVAAGKLMMPLLMGH